MDTSLLTDLKPIIPPIITLGIGIAGFLINTRARLKRFANERVSTLKDIQALPEGIVNEWYIQEEVRKQMRSSVLKDLTGISNTELAEKYLKAIANSEFDSGELRQIKKALPSMNICITKEKHTTFSIDKDHINKRAWIQLAALATALLITVIFECFAIYYYVYNNTPFTIAFTFLASASTGTLIHYLFRWPSFFEIENIEETVNLIPYFDNSNERPKIKNKSF